MARGGVDGFVRPGWAGRIDWSRPWLSPLRALGEQAASWVEDGAPVAEALNRLAETSPPLLAAGALRFVRQEELGEAMAYESFVRQTACVPTRDNPHDFFNGLMWLSRPLAKRRLNELQALDIERNGVGATRGPLRDALTLFDENAALLVAPPALADALRVRDWHALFVAFRHEWARVRIELFGHALIEKLLTPRKAITAHAWLVASLDDAEIAASLHPERLATKDFLPLPVLGIPGWWPDNEQVAFYDDPSVFRPPRG